MTVALAASDIATKIKERLPESILEVGRNSILVKPESLTGVMQFLKETPGLDFDYLNAITGVDYWDYFELVYQITSIHHNHSFVVKTRCYGRENPSIPSVTSVYRGADLQEREIYDLLGIVFTGHPNLKPILLWEGFQGYPLRKDYL
jgi:NADH-quinone oxidoreductase subunit C